jgi:hypothetical protein
VHLEGWVAAALLRFALAFVSGFGIFAAALLSFI